MTEITFSDPCVLFALRRESMHFRREFRSHQRFPGAPCWATFCGPSWLTVLVVETGMGADAANRAVDWILSKPLLGNVPYRPKVVLSAGFAGGLDQALKVGDIILASEVCDEGGRCWPATWPEIMPPGKWEPFLHRGRLLTLSNLATTAKQKHELAQTHNAVAVDMEAAFIARACNKSNIPFGCLRAITDTADTGLSTSLADLLVGGRVSWHRFLLAMVRLPKLIREVRRLAKDSNLAADRLGKALGELLTLTIAGLEDH
ncbi:MAG: hypothetical protein ACJ8FY_15270 [Gemmataceae bacterium]